WPPQLLPRSGGTAIEDALVQAALAYLRRRGARVVQSFLLPDEAYLGTPLERNGVVRVTQLLYMQHPLDSLPALTPAEARLTFHPYSEALDPLFREALLRSYEQTQDCPELTGARSVEQVFDGHRAQGVCRLDQWCLALDDGEPVGVLILCEMREWDSWDVSYVGVVPDARGRSVGTALTLRALRAARAGGASRVTLSVDRRNVPAWNLYVRLGFTCF